MEGIKISSLIAQLNKLDKDDVIIISSDSEGNSYSSLEAILKGKGYVILYPSHEYSDCPNEVVRRQKRFKGGTNELT